jgi:hypothetical protein
LPISTLSSNNLYDDGFARIVSDAAEVLEDALASAGHDLYARTFSWIKSLWDAGSPADYFMHPESYPILLLPWFLEKHINGEPDKDFQAGLTYSSLNGYYGIRLVDNLMDGHGPPAFDLLPALNFFHSQFQMPYQRYFPYGHQFWESFTHFWHLTAEATMADFSAIDITSDSFATVTARKTCAASIPVIAVCCKTGRLDLIAPWTHVVDLFSRWHQMKNDTLDWKRDLDGGTCTYFLSEAGRRGLEGESAIEWSLREGLEWGFETVKEFMDELKCAAGGLGSQDLDSYIRERERMMARQIREAKEGLNEFAKYTEATAAFGGED